MEVRECVELFSAMASGVIKHFMQFLTFCVYIHYLYIPLPFHILTTFMMLFRDVLKAVVEAISWASESQV